MIFYEKNVHEGFFQASGTKLYYKQGCLLLIETCSATEIDTYIDHTK